MGGLGEGETHRDRERDRERERERDRERERERHTETERDREREGEKHRGREGERQRERERERERPSDRDRERESRRHSLCLGVEGVRGPAVDEARVPGEPQRHQQEEERQHAALPEAHGPQPAVLLADGLVRRPALLRVRGPAAPRLPQAGGGGRYDL